MAKTTLEQLLVRCATPLKDEEKTDELLAAQDKSFHMVTHDLVREVTSPNSTVRKQAMHSLQVLAHVTGKSVTVIMEPHKEVNPELNARPFCAVFSTLNVSNLYTSKFMLNTRCLILFRSCKIWSPLRNTCSATSPLMPRLA